MICRVGDVVRQGRVVHVEQDISPATLASVIRGDKRERLAVTAPDPHDVHEYVGCLRPSIGLRTRTALAVAGRSRGLSTPHDETRQRTAERLDTLTVDEADLADRRQAVAEASEQTQHLRERVAEARGRLREREENGLPTDEAAAKLEDAIAELSAVETAAVAATQRLERASAAAVDRREVRERRMELEDRIANLNRRARAFLVDQLHEEYVDALEGVPGKQVPEDPFEADGLTAALAVGRVADLDAPVVRACSRFDSARAASEWLGAPVVDI